MPKIFPEAGQHMKLIIWVTCGKCFTGAVSQVSLHNLQLYQLYKYKCAK